VHTDNDPIDPKTLAEMGYEQRDVSTRPMMWAAFWLFVFTIGSGLLGALFIKVWNIVPEVVTEQRPFHKVQPPKDTPILQNNSDNTADIATLRRNEANVLLSTGQAGPGFYHIPIDHAIELIAKRGLPVTGTQTVTRPKPGSPAPQDDFKAVPQTALGSSTPRSAQDGPMNVLDETVKKADLGVVRR
jgi:hypothetical protein